jgi:ClpP class serine protease
MTLSFVNEILRGVWLLDSSVQEHYAYLAFGHLESVIERPKAHSSQNQQVNGATIVAIGMDSGRMYSMNEEPPCDEDYIGIINIEGIVRKNDYCGEIGTTTMQMLMRSNEQDPCCIGHILQIDSPGGSAANTQTFANFIRQDVQKPVVAHFNSMCASAAYYIACAADEVYAAQADDSVGSIGVYCTLYDYREAYKQKGIKEVKVYAPQSSMKNDIFEKALNGDIKPLQEEYLKPVADEFLATVNAMRPNLTDESALKGKLYAAKNAPKGMIDGIMTWEKALARVTELATKKPKPC